LLEVRTVSHPFRVVEPVYLSTFGCDGKVPIGQNGLYRADVAVPPAQYRISTHGPRTFVRSRLSLE